MNSVDLKRKFIYDYLEKNKICSMLDQKFVDEYIEKFNPKSVRYTNYGANKCKELSLILSTMYRDGDLTRNVVGLRELGMGFPKWIYVYEL